VDKGIWVTGSGQATGPRDECVITVGSQAREPSAAAALAASSESLEAMREVLLHAGLPPSALATSAVSLNPVYDDFPTVAGFSAEVRLTATTRDIAAVGQLLSAVVAAGGNAARVHEVSFRHGDASGLMAAARAAAWADARARATQLAELAGRELGDVLAIDETVARPRPSGPMRVAAAADSGVAGAMSLDAGEGGVVVTLTAGWSLR